MAHVKTVKKFSIFLSIIILMFLLLNVARCETETAGSKENSGDIDYEIVPLAIETLLDESNVDSKSCFTIKTPSLLYIVRTNGDGSASNLYAINLTDNTHYAGKLKNGDDHIRDISAGDLNGLRILAIATTTYVEVYQIVIKNQTIASDILQKIAFDGMIHQLIVFNANRDGSEGDIVDLCMIVIERFSKLHGALRLFHWIDSGFHLADERNTQEIHNIAVLAGQENGLQPVLFALKFASNKTSTALKTSIQIFQIDVQVKMKQRQQILVDIERFDAYTINGENYFLGCKTNADSQCIVYKMIGDEFIEQHHFENTIDEETKSKDWNKLAYTSGLIVAGFQSEIRGYFDPTMQDFFPVQLNRTHLVRLDLYTSESSRIFLILKYEYQRKVIVQRTELKVLPIRGDKAKTDAVEDCLDRLRKLIYSRKLILDKITIPETQNVERAREKRVEFISGRIDSLHLENSQLSTPSTLRKRLDSLRTRINDWIAATKSMKLVHVDNLIVKNLRYNKSLNNAITKTDDNLLIFNRNTTTQNLTTNYLDSVQSRSAKDNDRSESPLELNLRGNIKIRQINVKKIAKIDWSVLHSTTFLRDRDSIIKGSVQFQKPVQCQELTIQGSMNGKHVEDFFTLNTDQVIHSNIFISKFLAANMTAKTLNSFDVKDFALLDADNVINGPVQISNFKVAGNLTLAEQDTLSRQSQHIIGTRAADFLQIYTGKVIINGSLTLMNLTTSNDDTLLVVTRNDGQQVKLADFENVFWMRNEIQVFDTVSFQNSHCTASEILPSFLNDHLLSNYLLCSKNTASAKSPLNFKSATILGNLNTDLAFGSHRVEMLSANLVRSNERTEIYGAKNFQNIFKVQNLNAETINAIPTQNLVHKDQENLEFTGAKFIEKLSIRRKFDVKERLDVEFYNAYNMKEFFDSVLRTDRGPLEMMSVKFQNIDVQNLTVLNFNNIELRSISDFFHYENDSLTLRKCVNIYGGVNFIRNLEVTRLNEIEWDHYLNLLVKRNTGSWDLGGTKLFRNNVTVGKSFDIKNLNGLSVEGFFKHTLKRYGYQIIQAPWKFLNVKVENLVASTHVNNINIKSLINTDQVAKIVGNVGIASAKVEENIFGQSDLNLGALLHRLRFLDRSYWSKIRVQNDIKFPKKIGLYEYIEQNAVQYIGNHEILGKVRFQTVQKFLSIQSALEFNGKNLNRIVQDALVRNPSSKIQIVEASKYFKNSLKFSKLEIKGYLNVEELNNIDILNLNSSLYRRGFELSVRKQFKIAPIIGELSVYGSINTVDFANLVFILPNVQIPAFYTQQISIKNGLSLKNLNNVHLVSFLEGRVRLQGNAQEIFGYLTFIALRTKHVTFSSINGIDIGNLIFTECEFDQEIYGRKDIRGVLKLVGPAAILEINNVDIIQKYSKTLFLDQDLHWKTIRIIGNVRFDSAIKSIDSLNRHSMKEYRKQAIYLTNQLEKLRTTSSKPKISPKFSYLEIDSNYEVVWNEKSTDFQQIVSFKTDRNSYCNSSFLDIFRTNIDQRIAINQRFHTSIRSRRIENLNLTNENTCSTGHSKFNVNFKTAVHDFQFSSIIENFEIFNKIEAENKSESFLLIEFSSTNQNNSIVLIKFDATKSHIYPLQEIPTPSNRKFEMKLFRGHFNSFLVLPDTVGLNLFEFDRSRNIFFKKYAYRDSFDRVAVLEINESKTHAIFACYGKNMVAVYDKTELIQKIVIPGTVDNLVGVTNQAGNFLIVVSCENYFHLYRFEYFEGWVLKTFGYYRNLKYFIPYLDRFLAISQVENNMEAAVLRFHLKGLE